LFLWTGIGALFLIVDGYFIEPHTPAALGTDVSYFLAAVWLFWLARKAKMELRKKPPEVSTNI